MNLQLVTTGNIVPTCANDFKHRPFPLDYFGQGFSINAIIRPNQPVDRTLGLVQTDVARALGYKNPACAGQSMNLVEDQDFSYERIIGANGTHKTKVLTIKGLTKFLMRSDHKKAIEFQDMLASKSSDLAFYGIAFRDQSAADYLQGGPAPTTPYLTREDFLEGCRTIVTGITEAMWAKTRVRPRGLANELTDAGKRKIEKAHSLATAFIVEETGNPVVPHGMASGLTARCRHFAAEHCKGQDVIVNFMDGSKPVTYISNDILKLVHRNKWHKGNPNPLTHGLFKHIG